VFFNPLEGMKYVSKVWRVAAEYEVYIENKKIKVKILESPDGMFMGIYLRSSIEDALVDAVMGLLAFYKPEEAETCWIKDPEF
jgi:hypothetical protein